MAKKKNPLSTLDHVKQAVDEAFDPVDRAPIKSLLDLAHSIGFREGLQRAQEVITNWREAADENAAAKRKDVQ